MFSFRGRAGDKFVSAEEIKRKLGRAEPRPDTGLSLGHLRHCAEERPSLVLFRGWKPPPVILLIKGSVTDAILSVVDPHLTDPRYLVRLVRLLDSSDDGREKVFRFLTLHGHDEAQLTACWKLDNDSPAYAAALEAYVFDTLFSYAAVKAWFEQINFKVMEWGGQVFWLR